VPKQPEIQNTVQEPAAIKESNATKEVPEDVLKRILNQD